MKDLGLLRRAYTDHRIRARRTPLWLCVLAALPVSVLAMLVWHEFGGVPAAVVMIVLSLAGGVVLSELRGR